MVRASSQSPREARIPLSSAGFATVPGLVRSAGTRDPERLALIDGSSGAAVSAATLARWTDQVAAGLAERGFSAGNVLALRAPNSPLWAALAFGAMAAGGAVTAISPLATKRETVEQLTDAGALMLVTGPGLVDSRETSRVSPPELVLLGNATQALAGAGDGEAAPASDLLTSRAPVPGVDVRPDQLALVPYSSGTTGLPKGVMLTHANLSAAAAQLGRALALTPADRFLALAPFAHVMGSVVSLCAPLAAGATVVTLPRYELRTLLGAIERHRVTVAALPPPVVAAIARDPAVDGYDLSTLSFIVSGGAPLSPEIQQAVTARLPGTAVGQGYGLTETTAVIAVCTRRPLAAPPPGSVGRPVPGTRLRLVDPATGRDSAPGEPGEIWVRGPQVMTGYLGRPRDTAEAFGLDGWLRTGDLGQLDAAGNLSVTARLKELIKVSAYQVAPAEIEALLMHHPAVADAAVIPRPDELAGEVPVAVVVLHEPVAAGELMAWVADRVAPYKRLRAVRVTGRIPRTASGKILRRVLIEEDRLTGGLRLSQAR